jgi:hypothetical protein
MLGIEILGIPEKKEPGAAAEAGAGAALEPEEKKPAPVAAPKGFCKIGPNSLAYFAIIPAL